MNLTHYLRSSLRSWLTRAARSAVRDAFKPAPVVPAGARVYFLQASRSGLIKIGHSSDVESRIASLRTGSPEPLVLLAVMAGGREVEQGLHARFAGARVRGEWFRATGELVAFIEGVKGTGTT